MFLFKSNSKKVTVPCEFGYTIVFNTPTDNLYGCFFKDQEITTNHIDDLKYKKAHELPQSNDTIKKVEFDKCKLTRVPSGLKKLFPNFHTLIISKSDIRTITKYDLEEYKDLRKFSCSGCHIEYLPGDLFEDLKDIQRIEFINAELKFIEPNILDGLNNLNYAAFYDNPNYSACFRSQYICQEDMTLDKLKAHLHDKMIERYKPLKVSSDSEVKLKQQLKQAQDSRQSLNLEVERLKKLNENFINQQQESIDSLEEQIENLEVKIENYKAENKQLRIFGERQKQEVKEVKAEKGKINQELKALKDSQSKLTQQVQKLKSSEGRLNSENNQLKILKLKLESQLIQSTSSVKELNLQVKNLKEIEKNLTAKNQELEKLKASLAYDLAAFTQNSTTKDFQVIIEDQVFPVHRHLLIARSPTLADILKNNPDVENLNLVDISVGTFEQILKFLYNDELPSDKGTKFLHLFMAAGKLKIIKLVEHAAGHLIDQVDSENALTILPLSINFNLQDLKLKAFELLKNKYQDVKFEDEWLENPEKMIKVVAMLKKKEEILKQFHEEFKEVAEVM